MNIYPQKWFQTNFLSSPADIVVWWWWAWAWKSFSLLLEAVRHIWVQGYWWVIFRRTTPQIKNQWWLRDESEQIYSAIWMQWTSSILERTYKNWNKIKFAHIEHEKNKYDWQGSQIPFIWFDELTHFSESQFRYLTSRNRSTCWIKPYIRATCNPDPDSWVKSLIGWRIWEDGYIIKERDWVVRYFTRENWQMIWWDSKEEVRQKAPHLFTNDLREDLVKSFTFIEWNIYDNKKLLDKDPWYLANLMAQDENEKKRLLDKNWNITNDNTCIFDYNKIDDIFSNNPRETQKCITVDVARFWKDLAVITTWTINHKKRIDIFTKSTTSEIVQEVEKRRAEYEVGKSDVIIDQDWVWWGVVDEGKYNWYSWWAITMEDPSTKIKENYQNLKTQCQYRLVSYVNTNNFKIDNNYYVDWIKCKDIKIWNKVENIEKLIKEDLRSVKIDKLDQDGKKCIIRKEKQKIILWGRSPDFWDAIMMSVWFDLRKKQSFYFWYV